MKLTDMCGITAAFFRQDLVRSWIIENHSGPVVLGRGSILSGADQISSQESFLQMQGSSCVYL